jgi:mono/diheme cytochrome c family protein
MSCRPLSFALVSAISVLVIRLLAEVVPADGLWNEIYKSAWVGIYTSDQAVRGEADYRARCASCHGVSLEGTDDGPSLAGRDFREDWNGANVADLFEKIQFTMPANRPGRLTDDQDADILAYILKFNGFPAGRSALSTSVDELRGVRFVAMNPGR